MVGLLVDLTTTDMDSQDVTRAQIDPDAGAFNLAHFLHRLHLSLCH